MIYVLVEVDVRGVVGVGSAVSAGKGGGGGGVSVGDGVSGGKGGPQEEESLITPKVIPACRGLRPAGARVGSTNTAPLLSSEALRPPPPYSTVAPVPTSACEAEVARSRDRRLSPGPSYSSIAVDSG